MKRKYIKPETLVRKIEIQHVLISASVGGDDSNGNMSKENILLDNEDNLLLDTDSPFGNLLTTP